MTDPTGEDIAVLVRGLRRARQIAGIPPLSDYVLPGGAAVSDDDLIAHIRERSQTLYHPVGMCRLGTGGAPWSMRSYVSTGSRGCESSTPR